MNTRQQLLYDNLINELDKLLLSGEPGFIETSFWVSIQYWEELKAMVKGGYIGDDDQAIYFFKYVKPKFTSHIQYFTILSEALMFVPEIAAEQVGYWQNELERLLRYLARNHYFAGYYDSGATALDEKYFLSVTEDWVPSDKQFYYDADPQFCSPNDHQARGLLAYRRYHELVKGKLKE